LTDGIKFGPVFVVVLEVEVGVGGQAAFLGLRLGDTQ